MLIDTHCHLDFSEYKSDREAVIERAEEAGVKYLINVASSLEGARESAKLASTHENIFASIGIHPHHADDITEDTFAEIERLAGDKKAVAIGEIGLDYFKSPSAPDKQKELFVKFIGLSKKINLPLIIHNRDAHRDTLDILRKTCDIPIRGVMHCFSGDRKLLSEVLELGLFVSFTCNITFKNAARLREVAKAVPPEKLLLETDAPFLAPQAYRGKRNEPAYMTELRDCLSELLNLPKDEVERITTENAKRLFALNI
ncbi:MAG: TatD family hydrolase [Candidatus Omnitrophota bacterium]